MPKLLCGVGTYLYMWYSSRSHASVVSLLSLQLLPTREYEANVETGQGTFGNRSAEPKSNIARGSRLYTVQRYA